MPGNPFQQRDNISGPSLGPPWLIAYNSNGQKFLYTIGLALDALLEKQSEAMRAKCPGLADESAIPFQAADRLLVQGPLEPNPSFVTRLKGAFDAWSIAGSRASVLGQIQAYLTNTKVGVPGAYPEALIVGGNLTDTTWDSIYVDTPQGGRPSHTHVTPINWDWDTKDQHWRAWLVLFMHLVATGVSGSAGSYTSTGGSGVTGVTTGFATLTGLSGLMPSDVQNYITITGAASSGNNGTFQITSVLSPTSAIIANTAAVAPDANNGAIVWSIGHYPYIGPAPVWGSPDFVWGSTWTWGVNADPLIIESIRAVLKRWKSSATYYPYIIISFGGGDSTAGTEFSPNSGQGTGNPDGTWGDIGKLVGGAWVPAKTTLNPFTAFCDGSGVSIRCYEKNQT